jgi:hydroxymethylpyrimidine pyrophosphatase-like HAD family hydrolase
VILNPLADFQRLSALVTEQLEAPLASETAEERTLNVFLLVAGLHQILEDYLHRRGVVVARAGARLRSYDHRLASRGALAAETIAAFQSGVRVRRPAVRNLIRRAHDLTMALEATAAAVVGDDTALERAERLWRELRPAVDTFPEELLETTVRLPNPFTTFDQRPEDCAELMRRFAERWPDPERPVLVVGVRTSGTYLAPLCRALLIEQGYRRVQMLTIRAGQHWRREEIATLSTCVDDGGLVMITDDPPRSGSVLARVAQEFIDRGVPSGQVVLALQLAGDEESLPKKLRRYGAVLLPRHEWAIEERLSPTAVRSTLERMLMGREIATSDGKTTHVAAVEEVERLAADRPHARSRARVVYRVSIVGQGGSRAEHYAYVCGVGLGYFQDYHRAVAERLRTHLPEIYGIADGLLYRQWLPGRSRLAGVAPDGLEERISSYVLARREGLPVDRELAVRTTDQYASWDIVADILGRALLGRLRILVAPLTWAAARRLTAVGRPSLVDGSMSASNWFAVPSASPLNGLVKVDPDIRTFASAARVTYDGIFDLASAGASFDVEELLSGDSERERAFSERLVEAYESLSGEEVERERWFLYQVLQNQREIAGLSGPGDGESDQRLTARRLLATERALAAAEQRYVGDVFLADLVPAQDGLLCALDIDWVLETRWLDFPAITPNGALALRALTRHGFRPVLATGRALPELRARVRAYRLAGGVAEYGTAVYDGVSGRSASQLSPEEDAQLERLREALRGIPGAYVDEAHGHSVRAIRLVDGRRRGLEDETVAAALSAAGAEESVRVAYGHLQTDFAPASVDKGTGLRALARALGADPTEPFAFAIGDDLPDIPMLELAVRRFAPANASGSLRDLLDTVPGTQIVRRPRADGLLEAVKAFLGHDPRRCRICAPPELPPRTRLVTIPLAAADASRYVRMRHIAALAAELTRS